MPFLISPAVHRCGPQCCAHVVEVESETQEAVDDDGSSPWPFVKQLDLTGGRFQHRLNNPASTEFECSLKPYHTDRSELSSLTMQRFYAWVSVGCRMTKQQRVIRVGLA